MLSGKCFAELVRDARRARGLLLKDVASLVHVPISALSEIERSHRMPPKDTETLKRMARILGIEQAELVHTAHLARRAKSDVLFSRVLLKNPQLAEAMFRLSDTNDDKLIEQVLLRAIKEYALCTA